MSPSPALDPQLAAPAAAAAAALVARGAAVLHRAGPGQDVPRVGPGAVTSADGARSTSGAARAVVRIADAVGRVTGPPLVTALGPGRVTRLRWRLLAAGRPAQPPVEQLLGRVSALLLLGAAAGAWRVVAGEPLLGLGTAVLVLAMPELWLRTAIQRRQARLGADLPDFLDVFSTLVTSGTGLQAGLGRAAAAIGGVVGEEVRTTVDAMDMGLSRRSAFDALRERNPSAELRSFVLALQQSEELGSSITALVADQAERLRAERARAAKKAATRAEPRMILVMTLFFLPAFLLLIAGSLGAGLLRDFGGLFSF